MNKIPEPPANARVSTSGLTWLSDDGIIIAIANPQPLHTLENAIENTRINQELAGDVKRPFIIDLTKVTAMSREARAYYAGPEPRKSLTAVALITESNIGRLVANFFIGLTKPVLPTKLFNSYNEALEWVLKYK